MIIDDEPPRQSRRVRKEQPEYGRLEPSPRKMKPGTIEGSSPKRSCVSTTCCNCGELEPAHTTDDCPNSRLENEGYLMAIGTNLFNDYRKQITEVKRKQEELTQKKLCWYCWKTHDHSTRDCIKRAKMDWPDVNDRLKTGMTFSWKSVRRLRGEVEIDPNTGQTYSGLRNCKWCNRVFPQHYPVNCPKNPDMVVPKYGTVQLSTTHKVRSLTDPTEGVANSYSRLNRPIKYVPIRYLRHCNL